MRYSRDSGLGRQLAPGGKHLLALQLLQADQGKPVFRLQGWPLGGGPARKIADLPFENEGEVGPIAVSPDGRKIVVSRTNGPALLVSYPDGRTRDLPWIPEAFRVAWWPDSRHLVFAGRERTQLVIADTSTSARSVVLSGREITNAFSVSPDGTRIAYTRHSTNLDLLEIGLDGSYLRDLRATAVVEAFPDWSPSGDAFAHDEHGGGIWVRRSDGTGALPLADDPKAIAPAYSPDGRRIAFRASGGVFVVLATGGPRTVLQRPATDAAIQIGTVCWSPDGNWVAYDDGPYGNGELWKVESAGGRPPVKLVASGVMHAYADSCAWSPDGRTIAYRHNDGLHLMSADGSGDRLVYPGRITMRFLPSGELLVLRPLGQPRKLNMVRIDPVSGKQLSATPLALPAEYEHIPGSFSIHPDGKTNDDCSLDVHLRYLDGRGLCTAGNGLAALVPALGAAWPGDGPKIVRRLARSGVRRRV